MARRKFVAGNWKMYKTAAETHAFCEALRTASLPLEKLDVAVFPPFVNLQAAHETLDLSGIGLGAQNVYPAQEGAFTGEVSPNMLLTMGCRYVIIGHSERRALFGETDAFIRKKVDAAIAAGLVPVACVGETLEQRNAGQTEAVVHRQLNAIADGLNGRGDKIVIAYEPVWAIGTGQNATPAQAQEVHASIREWLRSFWGREVENVRILYGGSVKPANARELMSQPDIDGALVGGASLEPESFKRIVEAAV